MQIHLYISLAWPSLVPGPHDCLMVGRLAGQRRAIRGIRPRSLLEGGGVLFVERQPLCGSSLPEGEGARHGVRTPGFESIVGLGFSQFLGDGI